MTRRLQIPIYSTQHNFKIHSFPCHKFHFLGLFSLFPKTATSDFHFYPFSSKTKQKWCPKHWDFPGKLPKNGRNGISKFNLMPVQIFVRKQCKTARMSGDESGQKLLIESRMTQANLIVRIASFWHFLEVLWDLMSSKNEGKFGMTRVLKFWIWRNKFKSFKREK